VLFARLLLTTSITSLHAFSLSISGEVANAFPASSTIRQRQRSGFSGCRSTSNFADRCMGREAYWYEAGIGDFERQSGHYERRPDAHGGCKLRRAVAYPGCLTWAGEEAPALSSNGGLGSRCYICNARHIGGYTPPVPRRLAAFVAVAAAITLAAVAFSVARPEAASAHRNICHLHHACPSDHATYRWSGRAGGRYGRWLCVKPTSPKRNSTFRIKVRYAGLTYWRKR
jgi:hypothetical protein